MPFQYNKNVYTKKRKSFHDALANHRLVSPVWLFGVRILKIKINQTCRLVCRLTAIYYFSYSNKHNKLHTFVYKKLEIRKY